MAINRILSTLKTNAEQISTMILINVPDYVEPLINSGHFNQSDKKLWVVQDQKPEEKLAKFCLWCPHNLLSLKNLLPNRPMTFDWIIYSDDHELTEYQFLLQLLSLHGGSLVLNLSNHPNSVWWQLPTSQYLKITTKHGGMIQKKISKPIRVAILIVGLTRKFKEASQSFFENFIKLAPENVSFDFYLNTWDISGDYRYDDKNFQRPLELNWIKEKPLSVKDLEELDEIYHPKILQLENFQVWKEETQQMFEKFLEEHKITEEPLRVFNGIFGQYYQVYTGFKAMSEWSHSKGLTYDLVIRTRFDLNIPKPSHLDWGKLVDLGKNNIISLEQWDRNGIRGNWIAGSWELMEKYSQLWVNIPKIKYEQTKKIKLASIHVPKYIFNYFFADTNLDPEVMEEDAIFEKAYPYLKEYVNEFIKDVKHLTFHVSLIPEIFLQFYLETYLKLPVHIESFMEVSVLRDFEKEKDKNKPTLTMFNETIS